MTSTPRYWFKQKIYGYGAGPPVTWQGWVLLLGFLAMVGLMLVVFHGRPGWASVAVFILTIPFLFICRAKTEGGWRWRWGSKT